MTKTWLRAGAVTIAMTFATGTAYAQSTAGAAAQDKKQEGAQAKAGGQAGQKAFVQKMLMSNAAEIQLGKMGGEKATNAEVKSFAQMMVTHHTQANEDLAPLAKQHGLEEPAKLDAKHQQMVTKLSKLEGAAFDREFMNVMVTSHREAVAQTKPFAGAAGTSGKGATSTGTTGGTGTGSPTGGAATNPSGAAAGSVQNANQYAAKVLPTIQQHLQQALQIQKSLTKAK